MHCAANFAPSPKNTLTELLGHYLYDFVKKIATHQAQQFQSNKINAKPNPNPTQTRQNPRPDRDRTETEQNRLGPKPDHNQTQTTPNQTESNPNPTETETHPRQSISKPAPVQASSSRRRLRVRLAYDAKNFSTSRGHAPASRAVRRA